VPPLTQSSRRILFGYSGGANVRANGSLIIIGMIINRKQTMIIISDKDIVIQTVFLIADFIFLPLGYIVPMSGRIVG
jgi:hypothetical protein